MPGGLESGIFFADVSFYKKYNMKKLLLAAVVFLSMTGFTMAQDHHPRGHHHHRGHHRPVHHHPVHR